MKTRSRRSDTLTPATCDRSSRRCGPRTARLPRRIRATRRPAARAHRLRRRAPVQGRLRRRGSARWRCRRSTTMRPTARRSRARSGCGVPKADRHSRRDAPPSCAVSRSRTSASTSRTATGIRPDAEEDGHARPPLKKSPRPASRSPAAVHRHPHQVDVDGAARPQPAHARPVRHDAGGGDRSATAAALRRHVPEADGAGDMWRPWPATCAALERRLAAPRARSGSN